MTPQEIPAFVDDLFDAIVSEALALGVFERVNQHEPKNAPGNGISCSFWLQYIGPVRSSGLSITSGLVRFNARVQSNMLQEPQDDIDPELTKAAMALIGAYSGNLDLGLADVRSVDLLGQTGVPLQAEAGYISVDNRMYRTVVVTLPIIVNDLWEQA